MESLFRFVTPPSRCGYLPEQNWELEYEIVSRITPQEYFQRLTTGWRRFGHALFQPRCRHCSACQSLRVDVAAFRPNRSQRRAWKGNQDVQLRVGAPKVTQEKLDLYDRYHTFQAEFKDWPMHGEKDAAEYAQSFVDNPFPTEEWCYYLDGRLIGVGYVDVLPGGLSAIYFYYDPDFRQRSLGTYNILRILARAEVDAVPYVYLGFYVEGCRSLEYKARFQPNQILRQDGQWVPFLS